eukprot:5812278-Prymnesium_polylepis.1
MSVSPSVRPSVFRLPSSVFRLPSSVPRPSPSRTRFSPRCRNFAFSITHAPIRLFLPSKKSHPLIYEWPGPTRGAE